MKNTYLLIIAIAMSLPTFSQVGINTIEPTADLDVNGTIRLRKTASTELRSIAASTILGIDENGNVVELELDDNLYIENNVIKHSKRKEEIYNRPNVNANRLDNAVDIIWPGGTGNGRAVVRLSNSLGNFSITGIDVSGFATPMDAHGITVMLYTIDGDMTIRHNDGNSQAENRFRLADNDDIRIRQYEAVKVMYDGILQRWLVINKQEDRTD